MTILKTELAAARLALVSDAPTARRTQGENAVLRAENDKLRAANERLRTEIQLLNGVQEQLVVEVKDLKHENDLLTKENVALSAKLNRPAFLMPRKGRLPAREDGAAEAAEEGVRVVELDDEVPEPEHEPRQRLVKISRRG